MDWVVETVLPREVQKLSQKLEEHHRRTTQLQQAVEDLDNRIQAIEYENVGLQGEIRAKESPVNGAAAGVGSLVSCEIYQKINVHKTSTYSYIYRPYWCWKNTSGSRYDSR